MIALMFISSVYSQSISIGTVTSLTFCPGSLMSVSYTVTGTFNAGNMFILQMSDSGGTSFTTPTNLDTIVGTTNGTFNCNIPMGTSWSAYSFRVLSTNPSILSGPSGIYIMQFTPSAGISGFGPYCIGAPFQLSASSSTNEWLGPDGFTATNTLNVTFPMATTSMSGTYSVTVTNSHGCTNSASITVLVNDYPTVSFSYPGNDSTCLDDTITLSGGLPLGGIYSGDGVTGNLFNPIIADTGTTNILYTYTDGSGCSGSASINILVLGCLGINDEEMAKHISVYPNPSDKIIYVDETFDNMVILDPTGKVVLNGSNSNSMDVSALHNGIYFLIAYKDGRIYHTRFIKQ